MPITLKGDERDDGVLLTVPTGRIRAALASLAALEERLSERIREVWADTDGTVSMVLIRDERPQRLAEVEQRLSGFMRTGLKARSINVAALMHVCEVYRDGSGTLDPLTDYAHRVGDVLVLLLTLTDSPGSLSWVRMQDRVADAIDMLARRTGMRAGALITAAVETHFSVLRSTDPSCAS